MLLYLNSKLDIAIGMVIEIPALVTLFQEEITAKEDLIIQNTPESKTYRVIIDQPIHDPLVHEQNKHTYKPYKNGLYPDFKKDAVEYEEFVKNISNIHDSKEIFCLIDVLDQISDMGFKGVWCMERYNRILITINPMDALVIQEC